MYLSIFGKDGHNFEEVMSLRKSQKQMQRIVVVAVKLLLGLTQVARSQLDSIARNLLLKRVEIQHQTSYICMSIRMFMMVNLLLVNALELSMKNMKKYYGKKPLNLILMNMKHTTKLRGEKRRKEYTVLDLKQKLTMGRIFVPHHL